MSQIHTFPREMPPNHRPSTVNDNHNNNVPISHHHLRTILNEQPNAKINTTTTPFHTFHNYTINNGNHTQLKNQQHQQQNTTVRAAVRVGQQGCLHRGTTKCTVVDDSKKCCACLDTRPHQPFYNKQDNGTDSDNTSDKATRWEHYCHSCKVFWTAAIARSGVAPEDTQIPHYPTHARKPITPQNSNLGAASGNAVTPQQQQVQRQPQPQPQLNTVVIKQEPSEPAPLSPQKQQISPLSTSSGIKRPALLKLSIPPMNRPLPVEINAKPNVQEPQQQQQQQNLPVIVNALPQGRIQGRNMAELLAKAQALQAQQGSILVHQSNQPANLQRGNAVLTSSHNYPSPPMSSLSRDHSDYYSNDEDVSDDDANSMCSSALSPTGHQGGHGGVVDEEALERWNASYESQRTHTRIATRALVRGDFKLAEARFQAAFAIASNSPWKSSSRSDRVTLAIKIAEAQSSQGNWGRAMQTLEDASVLAEEMSTNELYYKVQLAMVEVGFKVAEGAEKRRKRVMRCVEEEYGKSSELYDHALGVGRFAKLDALSNKAREDNGEPKRKRVNVSGMLADMRGHKSDLGATVNSELEEKDDSEWNMLRKESGLVIEAMA